MFPPLPPTTNYDDDYDDVDDDNDDDVDYVDKRSSVSEVILDAE